MRKGLALAAVLAASVAASTAAKADGLYGFVDYDYIRVHGGSINGGDVGLGYSLSRYFGVEVAGMHGSGLGGSGNAGWGDAIVRLPINTSRTIDLFGAVGGEYDRFAGVHDFGVRAGGGVEFSLSNHWALRFGARYRSAIRSGVVGNAGIAVSF